MDAKGVSVVILLCSSLFGSVYPEAPQIAQVNVPDNLEEGQRFRLNCEILRGSLPISFAWQKDSSPFVPSDGVKIARIDDFQEQLQIQKLSAAHIGNYSCVTKNIYGSDQITAQVLMKYAPRWNAPADEATINLMTDTNTTIDCSARGHPTPTIDVMRGGQKVSISEDFRLQNGMITVKSVANQKMDHFVCVASNALGRIEKLIKVSLSGETSSGPVDRRPSRRCRGQTLSIVSRVIPYVK